MAKEVDTKGYVKLYRKAQEDEIFKNPYAWQLFTYCLFNATFDSRYGEVGTLITTKKDIANDLGLSRSALDKFMNFLKENKVIDYKTYRGGIGKTEIKILNYKKYQDSSM